MQNHICKILGDNIKRLRKARNLKQEELAELIGLEIKSLSLIETGKGFVSAKTLEKLASVLNVQASELFETQNSKDTELIYSSIIKNLDLIKNNYSKLQTVDIVIKSLI